MKIFIDNNLIQKVKTTKPTDERNSLLAALLHPEPLAQDSSVQIDFGWPSLLEYLDLGALFENFLKFDDEQNELFAFIKNVLTLDVEKDALVRLYDQLFVECLVHVKNLPQIHPAFLYEQIQKQRQKTSFSLANELFFTSLNKYEKALLENSAHTMHDLILHLAWDRVCTNLAMLFESEKSDPNFYKGIEVFKECLLESFQHITAHGRTAPGFFRLLETLYAYQMRQEKLQTYSHEEWLTLCQVSRALKPREQLIDVFYIDAAVVNQTLASDDQFKNILRVFTMDSVEKVSAVLSLADYMIGKLKVEFPGWRYALCPVEIVCLRENEYGFHVEAEIRH